MLPYLALFAIIAAGIIWLAINASYANLFIGIHVAPFAKFLIVTTALISSAVYFHFNREKQVFSQTLFGAHSQEVHLSYEQGRS